MKLKLISELMIRIYSEASLAAKRMLAALLFVKPMDGNLFF